MSDDIHSRAGEAVAEVFARHRRDLERNHRSEAEAQQAERGREIRSLAENHDRAAAQHRTNLGKIDGAERRAFEALHRQQRSVKGRMAGLFRPGLHERQAEAIAERFERQRMAEHLRLEARKLRIGKIEQDARLRHGKAQRAMHERHRDERRELADWQEQRRDMMIEHHARAMAEAQLRRALQQEQTRQHEQEQGRGLSRSLAR